MDAIAIVRMQNGKPFRECRNAFRWIETEENERLLRPIIEYSIRPKRPTSHMSQPFSFAQVEFASLEIRERPLRPLRSSAQAVAFHVPQPFSSAGLKLQTPGQLVASCNQAFESLGWNRMYRFRVKTAARNRVGLFVLRQRQINQAGGGSILLHGTCLPRHRTLK